MAAKKRVLLVANKWWECDPLMFVLLNDSARPFDKDTHTSILGWPNQLNHPHKRPLKIAQPPPQPPQISAVPRAVFELPAIAVEVWCISDLLEKYPDKTIFQSSSELKAYYLPNIFAGRNADFVIAFGTAGYPSEETQNGGVVVGSRIFMHNGHPSGENKHSDWQKGPFDSILESGISNDDFNRIIKIETSPKPTVMNRFIVPPLNPAKPAKLTAEHDFVGLGTVNVTDYSEYEEKDCETLDAFAGKYEMSRAKSMETTHGLIRVQSEAPFIFISGITDRVGHFNEEVKDRPYAQNTTAAHNAGVVAAWMLPRIDDLLS
jgi:hypothetical protein